MGSTRSKENDMAFKVDSAVIMAAGTASRFAPLSHERPKALIEVKGEVLIERQIRQLREAGIENISVVVGYMKEHFSYLADAFGVKIIENEEFLTRNNNGSIYAAREEIKNTYICSSDNYFSQNPFESEVEDSYYAAVYSEGKTQEWCMTEDEKGFINSVTIGGENAWFMLGHTFWSEEFSREFLSILEKIYHDDEVRDMLWEKIFMGHLDTLKMKIRKYPSDVIFEFDTLDELREFDESYRKDTRSEILKRIAEEMAIGQDEITRVLAFKDKDNAAAGFTFTVRGKTYQYHY